MNYNQIAARYIEAWNTADPAERRKIIDEIWAEDGSYRNRLFVADGRDMLDAVAGTAQSEYAEKGLSYRTCGDAYGHHNGFKFTWVLADAQGVVDTYGEEFVILDEAGRIKTCYQFGLRPPAI
ncbi:hypothetical protein [Longispora albida]|uniref:hypothetical protein n=1 Tax=Longispora albida TaxID=203523 RepID=UPI000379AF14|nr:hypothetical protein [Longispora albida]